MQNVSLSTLDLTLYHYNRTLILTPTHHSNMTLKAHTVIIGEIYTINVYRCTVHSDIHTVHSPTDAHLLEL